MLHALVVAALLAPAAGLAVPGRTAGHLESAAPSRQHRADATSLAPATRGQARQDWAPQDPADATAVPLAQATALLRRAGQNVLLDDTLDERYAYRVERRDYAVSAFGKLSDGPVKTYDVGRSPVWPELVYRRLVAVDGRPVSTAEAARLDAQHRREAADARTRRSLETPQERNQRLRREIKARREAQEGIEDFFRVYEFSDTQRTLLDGREVVVVTLSPRPGAATRTDIGRQMKKWAGRVWVDPEAAQLVQIEVDAREDVTFGLGVIGRIHKGSRAWYRRGPIADGTWVPLEARFTGSGRTLMLRPFRIDAWSRYGDYRRLRTNGEPAADRVAPPPPAR